MIDSESVDEWRLYVNEERDKELFNTNKQNKTKNLKR